LNSQLAVDSGKLVELLTESSPLGHLTILIKLLNLGKPAIKAEAVAALHVQKFLEIY
jgi:hypothetical protein